jgi:hypothetical protein
MQYEERKATVQKNIALATKLLAYAAGAAGGTILKGLGHFVE